MRLTTRNTETAGTGVEENIPFVIGVVAAAAEDGNEPTYADLSDESTLASVTRNPQLRCRM